MTFIYCWVPKASLYGALGKRWKTPFSPLSAQDYITWCWAITCTVLQSLNMVHPSALHSFVDAGDPWGITGPGWGRYQFSCCTHLEHRCPYLISLTGLPSNTWKVQALLMYSLPQPKAEGWKSSDDLLSLHWLKRYCLRFGKIGLFALFTKSWLWQSTHLGVRIILQCDFILKYNM